MIEQYNPEPFDEELSNQNELLTRKSYWEDQGKRAVPFSLFEKGIMGYMMITTPAENGPIDVNDRVSLSWGKYGQELSPQITEIDTPEEFSDFYNSYKNHSDFNYAMWRKEWKMGFICYESSSGNSIIGKASMGVAKRAANLNPAWAKLLKGGSLLQRSWDSTDPPNGKILLLSIR